MEDNKQTQQQTEEREIFYIYLKMDPYLAQWLIHKHGGEPVEFPKNSIENDIIGVGLTTPPPMTKIDKNGNEVKVYEPDLPGEGKVAIVLPYFKYKDVRFYNFLPISARDSLVQCIRARFAVELWKDLYKFGYIGRQKQNLIYTWMASHGIEDTETNFLAISKMYFRKRDAFRKQVKPNHKKS